MFFQIMIGQNPKKSNPKKIHFLISYNVMLEYICAKTMCHNVLKMQIYSKND
jgi:hypothetical protein